ncbi:MAG TPA: hypothetical protein VEF03_07050 [Candidatus Binataceae bacterium]|nr:hypothetical protein [Candidatus Binataceae bacterium]
MARKRKKQRRSRSFLAIAAIAVLIAGFVARRVMVPYMMHALTYRPPDHPQAAHDDSASGGDNANPPVASNLHDDKSTNPNASPAPSDERITEHDRRALDELIKQKSH